MKKIIFLLMLSSMAFSQNETRKEDFKTSGDKPDASLTLRASINQSTGKVKESLPIASILCRSVSFDVTFNYDGSNVFKQAKYQNRYMPTGILGLGWDMSVPKISCDTKETVSRDDDTFYFNGTELVCTKRPFPIMAGVGDQVWEFKTKTQMNYVIKYYEFHQDYNMSSYTIQPLDYWEITNDKGQKMIFGNNDNTRESVWAWGNWIGDSKNAAGASNHTIGWNLSTLSDQWNNQLTFTYLEVEQTLPGTSLKQTEASYLSEINSGTGERIVFNYSLKTAAEYYEPNIEIAEPDAYQERYEKNYLDNVLAYNSKGGLITKTVFTYSVATASGTENKKRYLEAVTIYNEFEENLPPQKFEYYVTGPFAGGLKSKTNPQGGIVNYEYENKYLFNNNGAESANGTPYLDGQYFARYNADNYKLILRLNNAYSGDFNSNSSHMVPFFIDRYDWNGKMWMLSRFFVPENMRLQSRSGNLYLDNAKFVFNEDFYAMLVFNPNTKKGNLYMWHKLLDGTWNYSVRNNLDTGGASLDDDGQDPVLLSGEDYIAIGTNELGNLYTYTWNNISWNDKLITQNTGRFYYGAGNNFITVVDYQTGADMANIDNTGSTSHYDKYYIHYLSAEKKWQTKSWTNFATSIIGNVSNKSFFYPSNSMTSFVAANNPEYLLRWDKNYNLNKIDNLFSVSNDNYPILNIGNNIFGAFETGTLGLSKLIKSVGVSGEMTVISPDLKMKDFIGMGKNRLLGLRWEGGNTFYHDLRTFNPNTNLWNSQTLTLDDLGTTFNFSYGTSYGFTNDFFLSGNRLHKLTNNGISLVPGLASTYEIPYWCFTGYDYLWAVFRKYPENTGETKYFYMDKADGTIKSTVIYNFKLDLNSSNMNMFGDEFGGKYPLFSSKNVMGRRLVDSQIGNNVYDIVVSRISRDNISGQVTYTNYTYDNFNVLIDDTTIMYGTVTVEEKGAGSASNGYIKYYYDNGSADASRVGLLTNEEYYNVDNQKIKEVINTYTKTYYPIYNTLLTPIYYQLDIKKTKATENNIFIANGGIMTRTLDYIYNQRGDLIESKTTNSAGLTEKTNFTYAEDIYPFLTTKNILGSIYKKTDMINSVVVASTKSDWIQSGLYVYPTKNYSGPNDTTFRLMTEVKNMDNYGNVVETYDDKGLTSCVLMGNNYKYPVATIKNVTQAAAISALAVSYSALQSLSESSLETELLKLYTFLPKSASISLNIYDNNGNLLKSYNDRKNAVTYVYDQFNRLKYTTDKSGNVIQARNYNYKIH